MYGHSGSETQKKYFWQDFGQKRQPRYKHRNKNPFNTKRETEFLSKIKGEIETPIALNFSTTSVHNEEMETLNWNADKPKIPLDATYEPRNDVDTIAPVTKNPYVDKNVEFSPELFKDKHTYV